MTATLAPHIHTVADLIERLGSVPPDRILFHPAPGTATEDDLATPRRGDLCELVDGTLVRKPMGYYEARLAIVLAYFLEQYLADHNLGIVLGADGLLRLAPGLVRLPDVCFIPWRRLSGGVARRPPVLAAAPELAVEILSESNTAKEMARKLAEYFGAGTRVVWILEPDTRTLRVYTAPEASHLLTEADTVDGGDVLPGFTLSLRTWLDRAEHGLGPRVE